MSARIGAGVTGGKGRRARARRLARAALRHARRSQAATVDYYEHATDAIADFQERVSMTTVEPAASIGAAYADVTRELAHAQVLAVRRLLKL